MEAKMEARLAEQQDEEGESMIECTDGPGGRTYRIPAIKFGPNAPEDDALARSVPLDAHGQPIASLVAVEKRPWTEAENVRLRELVERFGAKRWSLVALHLPGRVGKQCRERWHNHLSPAVSKKEWSEEEDSLIFEYYVSKGKQWSEIAKLLPGRTDNAIKNRYYSTLRRLQRVHLKEGKTKEEAKRLTESVTLEQLEDSARRAREAAAAMKAKPAPGHRSPNISPLPGGEHGGDGGGDCDAFDLDGEPPRRGARLSAASTTATEGDNSTRDNAKQQRKKRGTAVARSGRPRRAAASESRRAKRLRQPPGYEEESTTTLRTYSNRAPKRTRATGPSAAESASSTAAMRQCPPPQPPPPPPPSTGGFGADFGVPTPANAASSCISFDFKCTADADASFVSAVSAETARLMAEISEEDSTSSDDESVSALSSASAGTGSSLCTASDALSDVSSIDDFDFNLEDLAVLHEL